MNLTFQRLGFVTLSFLGLCVVVPRFGTACAPPPAPAGNCPSSVMCSTTASETRSDGEVLYASGEHHILCDTVDSPDETPEVRVFFTEATSATPTELEADLHRSGGSSATIQATFQAPDEAQDWAELEIHLEYPLGGCTEEIHSLGPFLIRANG